MDSEDSAEGELVETDAIESGKVQDVLPWIAPRED